MSKTRGRTLQRVEDKNNLLIHIRMTECLKKKKAKCWQEMETFVSLRSLSYSSDLPGILSVAHDGLKPVMLLPQHPNIFPKFPLICSADIHGLC